MKPAYLTFLTLSFWITLAVIASLHPSLVIIWEISGLILLCVTVLDAWRVWRIPTVMVERDVSGSLPLNVWNTITLQCSNPALHPVTIDIFDDHPPYSEIQDLPQRFTLPAFGKVETQYRLCPQQRGSTQFSGVYLQLHSPWRFWSHHRYVSLLTPIKVYPNFAAITKYALFATKNRLGQLGIHKLQRRGEGLEFHQLREYRTGDTLRQVDWHATSRYKKLISKEYQDERDQQVIFLIDCGRRMLAQDGILSHFDSTLNALLLLSYVALRQGDALGLLTFGGEEQRWLPPRKGLNTINTILNTVYDLQPSLRPSDYLYVVNEVMHRQNKRTLVILVTNLRDEDHEELFTALQLLRKKHLVLLANLQERIFNEVLERPIDHFKAALDHAAVLNYLHYRRQVHHLLSDQGMICLDIEPEQLPVMIVNLYLEIKRSGRL